jgi:lipoprotein-anchoring transpeptidase ErfK/SrfK
MKTLKFAGAIVMAVLLSFSSVVPTMAARLYNFDTNSWEGEIDVVQSPLRERPTRNTRQTRSNSGPIRPETIAYETTLAPGSIVVETSERRLYFVLEGGQAIRYGVGVGREGFTWSGTNRVTRMAEWPGWTPPAQMRQRVPDLPAYMPGGPDNPLGARALYIGSTLYRIHGTSEPWTIGQAVSSGCIRMTNEDVIDLYNRVHVGALVVVH